MKRILITLLAAIAFPNALYSGMPDDHSQKWQLVFPEQPERLRVLYNSS